MILLLQFVIAWKKLQLSTDNSLVNCLKTRNHSEINIENNRFIDYLICKADYKMDSNLLKFMR